MTSPPASPPEDDCPYLQARLERSPSREDYLSAIVGQNDSDAAECAAADLFKEAVTQTIFDTE